MFFGTQTFVPQHARYGHIRNKTTDDRAHRVIWNIPGTATGLPEVYLEDHNGSTELPDDR